MTSPPFVARASTAAVLSMLAWALGLTGLFAWGAVTNPRLDIEALIFYWGGLGLFGFCVVLALLRLNHRRPLIEIDAAGLRVFSRPALPWSLFTRAQTSERRGRPILVLWLVEQESKRIRRPFGPTNHQLGDIVIGASGIDRSFEDLLEAVRWYAPQLFADLP